ncbi:MAG: BTAD domain-containing putative transcriptional regulator [Gemmatimonadota bacterium]|jgi:DNA-binding SARP family transcriptional activator/TolB-like protein/Tfp pilus assembly protein PilF
MLHIRAFGSFDLRGEGESLPAVLSQSKRAALLAYLVLARPGALHRRDALLALFWPESGQARGRNALSQSLTFLRRKLPEGVLVTRGTEEVGVAVEQVDCDVMAFEAAVAEERWEEALGLYRGPLLEGLHVAGAPAFMDWLDRERERLREMASGAAWRGAHANIGAGALTEAERLAQRALRLVPTDESPVRDFIEALAGAGDRAAALRFYEKFVAVLADELEVEPAPETVAVAEAVRSRDRPVEPVVRAADSPFSDGRREPARQRESGGSRVAGALGWLHRPSTIVVTVAAVVVLAAMTDLGLRAFSDSAAGESAKIRTVGVVPFRNLSGDAGQDYLAEGMTHALIVGLTRIDGLKVVANRGATGPLDELGARMGVDTLIECSVVRDGNRVRVMADLKRGSTGEVLWSESYDRDVSDVLALQADIARAIAQHVDVALTAVDERRLAETAPRAPNAALIDPILQVHHLIWRSTPEDLHQAIRLLEQALDLAPDFAPAWSALAMAYLTESGWFAGASADSVMPQAQRALARALALDPGDVDAQAVLAETYLTEWRWEEAEQGYRKAMARDPVHWLASVSLPNLLTFMGRYDEAISMERRIVAMDPLSPEVYAELYNTLVLAGKTDSAAAVLQHTVAMDPTMPVIRELTTAALAALGHCEDDGDMFPADLGIGGAVAEADRLVGQVCGEVPFCLFLASYAYQQCGQSDRAIALYNRVEANAGTTFVSPVERAEFHLAMGDRESALDLLEEGLRAHEVNMMVVPNGLWFRSLQGDPRFEAIVDSIGLPRDAAWPRR